METYDDIIEIFCKGKFHPNPILQEDRRIATDNNKAGLEARLIGLKYRAGNG